MKGAWTRANDRVCVKIENIPSEQAKPPKRDVGMPPERAVSPKWDVFPNREVSASS